MSVEIVKIGRENLYLKYFFNDNLNIFTFLNVFPARAAVSVARRPKLWNVEGSGASAAPSFPSASLPLGSSDKSCIFIFGLSDRISNFHWDGQRSSDQDL